MARNYRKGISTEEAFEMLTAAALAGARCPVSRVNGLTSQITSELARAGRIRIDVYPHNWRVVTIMVGPHSGSSTAPPPNRHWRPYLTIQKGSEPKSYARSVP